MLIHDVIPLSKLHHNVKYFDCGTPSITQYLGRYAVKNMGLKLSNTFVLAYQDPAGNQKQKIAGFYTLASVTVAPENVPSDKKLPGYPVPLILLAQFGIDKSVQGQGLGKKLLFRALRHAYQICCNEQGTPAIGVVLDAVDESALSFYQSFDYFLPFPGDPMRLFVPIAVLADI
jgi:GNAT superfamily N-acetyltransferase